MEKCIIYLIINTINDKVYVGQTWQTLEKRWYAHYKSSSTCVKLSRAIKKYGRDNFTIQPLMICDEQIIADYLERFWITTFDSIENGYNLKEGGANGKPSLETRQKMSITHVGKNNPMFGKTHTAEAKKNMSEHRNTVGENNGRAILNSELVEKIKTDPRSERALAKALNVSRSTINSVRRGINWSKND